MTKSAPKSSNEQIYQLKITVNGVSPQVWRRVLVPASATLDDLHEIIQGVFEWENCHMHVFETEMSRYTSPDFEEFMQEAEGMGDSTAVQLHELYEAGDPELVYNYDFGDDWYHVIKREKVLEPVPGRKYPEVIAGKGAGPLEDSGGFLGYNDLVLMWKNPPEDPEDQDLLEWAGPRFNPTHFDLGECNRRLAKFHKPRVVVRATAANREAKKSVKKAAKDPKE
jgi:hypothetical protein